MPKMLALAATNRHQASVDVPVQNLPGSGSRKFPISYPVFAFSFALGRDQAPVSRQAWTIGAAGQRVVIEIPDGRSLYRGAVERIIGLAVAIKIGYPYHAPARRKSRPIQAGAENVVVKIPNRRLVCDSVI